MRTRGGAGLLVLVLGLVATACSNGAGRATTPVPAATGFSYTGIGYAAVQNGKLIVISRQGTRHRRDPDGRITRFSYDPKRKLFTPDKRALIDEPGLDERSVAGGLTTSGAIIVFYAAQDPATEKWVEMKAARIDRNGTTVQTEIPTAPDASFSPYGPLVILPSGRLMQTAYGRNNETGYRVRAFFSNDDGRSWPDESQVVLSRIDRPSEAAAAFVDGKTDETSRLVLITKTERKFQDGTYQSAAVQFTSVDGGRTWRRRGPVAGATASAAVIPWIAAIGGGRAALVWIDRASLTLKVSVAKWSDVFDHPESWPAPRTLYKSKLPPRLPKDNRSDFGYPSIARTGPKDSDVYVVFYDTTGPYAGAPSSDVPTKVELLALPLLKASA